MLRILLIILVALAVIMGLMQLTGARSGDPAPAAVAVEEAPDVSIAPEEPAIDDAGALEGEAAGDVLDPAIEPGEDDDAFRTGDNASPDEGPVTDPVPAVEEPLAEPAAAPATEPVAPGN